MKTSDKLLLGSVLSALVILCVVHLSLYAKYTGGNIMTEKDRGMESLMLPGEKAPTMLSIKGNLNIQAEPSERFSLEGEIRSGVQVERRRSGDTLFLLGDTSRPFDVNYPWEIFFNMRRINLRCGLLKQLIVSDGMVVLKGQDKPGGRPIDLRINHGQAWLGEPNENFDPPKQLRFFDSLHIDEFRSKLTLQNCAFVRALDCQLDDESQLVDLHASIASPRIRYADHSRINLTGSNFKKLQGLP